MLRRLKPTSFIALLLVSAFAFLAFPPAFAVGPLIQTGHTNYISGTTSASAAFGSNVVAGNVLVAVFAGAVSGSTCPTLGVPTDTRGNTFTAVLGPVCLSSGGAVTFVQIYLTTTTAGADTITQTSSINAFSQFGIFELHGVSVSGIVTGTGTGTGTATCSTASTAFSAISIAIAGCGQNVHNSAWGSTDLTLLDTSNLAYAGIGSSTSLTSPTFFHMGEAFGSNTFSDGGAIFKQAVQPGVGTCSILNPDAGNYLLPNGKYYDFHCVVNSQWIGTYAPILGVRITFNDSVHTMILSYSNNTAVSYGVGFSVLNGSSTATLSPSSTAVGTFDPVTQNRTFTIDYLVSFNAATLVDSVNRGIYLFAFTDLLHTRGPVYLGNSFNFLNKGGGVDTKSHGKCGVYPGSDTFQDYCYFGSDSHNWIAENATYYQLQQYQAQFFLETDNQTSAGPTFTANSPQTGYFWQPFSESGAGTNPSSNKGDFQLRMGLYHYDNTTWVKGLNVLIQMGDGRVGSSNLWTHLVIQWYNGPTTLIANQSIYVFVPQINLSQVGIWVNLWYSQNNMSTTQGGMVGSYYTGMHKTGFLIFTTWSPFLQNQTESQVFAPLLDHTGKVMSTQLAQFTKVYENLTRPGAPLVHAKQFNFQIQTTNFKEQEFNTASAGMGGITTPTFAGAIVPVISSPSVFSPIINAIKAIATYISKALVALGQVVWAALGHQFPWFTQFWTFVGVTVLSFITILGQIAIGLYQVLIFIVNNISNVVGVPFNILGTTYTNILSLLFAFTHYLPANEIVPVIQLFIIISFGLSVFEALATGDWPFIIRFTKNVWNVTNSVFTWTWALVKVMIDTIEGLIP